MRRLVGHETTITALLPNSYGALLLLEQLLNAPSCTCLGKCFPGLVTVWIEFFGLGNFQKLCTKCIKNHQSKGELLMRPVDSVNQRLFCSGSPVVLELFRKVRIEHSPLQSQVFNELFGTSLIEIAYVGRFGHNSKLICES